ncbi:MAG: hypothetical protein ACI9SE_001022 [Neolewinella sp.]
MNDRLHPLLLLLTLLDLGFVHATGAVDALPLLPMWLFALASPRLRRLQRFPFYRHAWNGGVLIVFSLLVHHATTTGLLHMLEDGLVLAVLCQVHLLNNIGERQRPDLTFFNSFLIAFVTSFFAPDFWWSLLFVGHTLAFVPALQVYALTGRGRDISAIVMRSVVRDSVPRTLAISVATMLVFVLWPRDFQRSGWLKDTLAIGQQMQVGLAERIDLDRETKPYLSDKIALRIEMLEGNLSAVPTHWRANVFSEFDGRTWFPQDVSHLGSRFASDTPWSQANGIWQRRSRGEPHTKMLVQQMDGRSKRLATTLAAVRLTMRNLEGRMLSAKSYAGFAIIPSADAPSSTLAYTVELAQPQPTSNISERARQHFVSLPERGVPRMAYDLGLQLRRSLPQSANGVAIATAVCNWLQSNRRYELPGNPGFASNIGEFLLGTAAGHCEYFATTLALLLRTQGVPCRIVGGYLAHERTEDQKAVIARERDAHAWVEVLGRDGTWHTFDATPAADVRNASRDGTGFWQDTSSWLQSLWSEVTSFDSDSRQRWLTLPLRHPIAFALAIAAAVVWMRRRRKNQPRVPAITNFQQALQRCKLSLLPGETPRELMARAAKLDLAPDHLRAIESTAAEHERSRYRQ